MITPAGAPAEQLQKLLAEKQELMDTLVRRQADFENYRKRVEKERHHERQRGIESAIEHVLPVLDAFDNALAGLNDAVFAEYRKGFELIRRQLWESLAKQGLVRIDAMGQEFNPHFHHAIQRVETSEHADGIVIAELQPGIHDSRSRSAAGNGSRRGCAGGALRARLEARQLADPRRFRVCRRGFNTERLEKLKGNDGIE